MDEDREMKRCVDLSIDQAESFHVVVASLVRRSLHSMET